MFLQQTTHFPRHVYTFFGASCFYTAMECFRNVDCETLYLFGGGPCPALFSFVLCRFRL